MHHTHALSQILYVLQTTASQQVAKSYVMQQVWTK